MVFLIIEIAVPFYLIFLAGQEEKIGCKDKDSNCPRRTRHCHLSATKKDCPLSCNVNKCANMACIDIDQSCPGWANKLKHCHKPVVARLCPKSCNLCINGEHYLDMLFLGYALEGTVRAKQVFKS